MQQTVRAATEDLEATIGSAMVRWVPPQNLHLTLKFLGDTPDTAIEKLKAGLHSVVSNAKPFDMVLSGIGCFPNPRKPRVIWVGIDAQGNHLQNLQVSVEAMTQAQGFITETKPFRPHLTIGRVKGHIKQSTDLASIGRAVEQAQVGEIGIWPSDGISLMSSKLTPRGAVYTCIYQYKMG